MIHVTIRCGNSNGNGLASYYIDTDFWTVASQLALQEFNKTASDGMEIYEVKCARGHGTIVQVPEGETEGNP